MLIARGQTIAGVDAIELRALMRELQDAVFTAEGFAHVAGNAVDDSDTLFGALDREGLIEPAPADALASSLYILGDDEDIDGSEYWRTSVDGRALAKARIGKPMRRDEAKRRLDGVIARAREVNRDPNQLFWVESIELFGSLTDPDAQNVGDIDLRVVICRRLEGHRLLEELNRRRRGGPLDVLESALRQLRRRLTHGSPKVDVQLDEFTSRPLPEGANAVLVYARDNDSPVADETDCR